jgi:hypothetical protein
MIQDTDKVIAAVEEKYFSIYTFVKPGDDIDALLYKADHQYQNFPEWNKKHLVMTYKEYLDKEREFYMSSCSSVDEEKYYEMLEVLPPIYINTDTYKVPGYKILNAWMVMEPLSGGYYNGYIKYTAEDTEDIRYATKVIYRGDRSTYWTTEDLDKLEKGEDK